MWKQIVFVVVTNLRSLTQRRASSSVIVVGMAIVVAVLVALIAMVNGFNAVLAGQGRQDRAIVLGSGASAELISGISRANVATIVDSVGIKKSIAGKPLASPETLMLVTLPKSSNGRATSAILRGADARAFTVRPEIKIVAGRMFRPGVSEVIVGKGAQRLYRGLEIGDRIALRGAEWLIVGEFTSNSDVHESELIGAVDALMSAYHRDVYQSVIVVLDSATSPQKFAATLKTHPNLRVEVDGEREFYSRQAKTVNDLFVFITVVVGGFMGIGALFAALDTMYSAVSIRTTEIAMLRAIGFTPIAVVISIFTEAILLALLGAIVGVFLAWLLFGGRTLSSTGSSFGGQVTFDMRISSQVLAVALEVALITAIIGALFPAIRAARMQVVDAMRST